MNYDLMTLVAKLRKVENLDDLNEVKELGESFMRKEKNYAIFTLMAVAEELGDEGVTKSLEDLKTYIEGVIKNRNFPMK